MNLSEPTRAYIYRVLFAAGVVAIAYGLLTAEQVDVWRTLAEAVLVIGGPGQAAFVGLVLAPAHLFANTADNVQRQIVANISVDRVTCTGNAGFPWSVH